MFGSNGSNGNNRSRQRSTVRRQSRRRRVQRGGFRVSVLCDVELRSLESIPEEARRWFISDPVHQELLVDFLKNRRFTYEGIRFVDVEIDPDVEERVVFTVEGPGQRPRDSDNFSPNDLTSRQLEEMIREWCVALNDELNNINDDNNLSKQFALDGYHYRVGIKFRRIIN